MIQLVWRFPDAQNRQSWNYPVRTLDSFLLVLFEKYAELLKRRFSDDFQEVIYPSITQSCLC